MKVGLAQINPTVGDFRGNSSKIQAFYQDAVKQDCGLVVFPELALTGCHPRDLLLRRAFVGAANRALELLARRIGPTPALVGTVTVNQNVPGRCLYNSVALLRNGVVEAIYHKRLLASHDMFDEDRYFEPGDQAGYFDLEGGARVGIAIGDDLWNDEDFWEDRRSPLDPVRELIDAGCNLIVSPAASPWALGRDKLRRAMIETVARDEQIPVLLCNMVGGNDHVILDGSSLGVTEEGAPLAYGVAFEEQLLLADVGGGPVAEEQGISEEEQLLDALVMGTHDFLSKCGVRRALLGLGGTLNSAVAAVIVSRAMGPANVVGVVLPSRGSDPGAIEDSRALAEKLGIEFQSLPVEEAFQSVRAQAGKSMSAAPQDATEDALLTRLRGLLLAAVAERQRAVVISTGDKSDFAIGRLETGGAFAPLGDVPKTIVARLAEFINHEEEIISPGTFTRAAGGELGEARREADANPTSQLLDGVLGRYIEEDCPIDEIVGDGFERALVRDLARRADQAEARRQQNPPCLKVTPRAFGPGRRLPIAQRFSEW